MAYSRAKMQEAMKKLPSTKKAKKAKSKAQYDKFVADLKKKAAAKKAAAQKRAKKKPTGRAAIAAYQAKHGKGKKSGSYAKNR